MSRRRYKSLDDALAQRQGWQKFPQGGCSCSFGVCTRIDPDAGDKDLYEPCEPALERDDLPWFYFIPSTNCLAAEFHEKYRRESRELWGDNPAE